MGGLEYPAKDKGRFDDSGWWICGRLYCAGRCDVWTGRILHDKRSTTLTWQTGAAGAVLGSAWYGNAE
jgi:hypothetical protein